MKWLLWIGVSPLLLLFTVAWLNDNGFCYRTHHFITDEEMVDAAIKEAIQYNNRSWTPIKGNKPIPIKDVAEFKRLNPECCGVGFWTKKHAEPPRPVSFMNKVTGKVRNYVFIKANRRLVDESGRQMIVDFSGPIYVSNCGRIVD